MLSQRASAQQESPREGPLTISDVLKFTLTVSGLPNIFSAQSPIGGALELAENLFLAKIKDFKEQERQTLALKWLMEQAIASREFPDLSTSQARQLHLHLTSVRDNLTEELTFATQQWETIYRPGMTLPEDISDPEQFAKNRDFLRPLRTQLRRQIAIVEALLPQVERIRDLGLQPELSARYIYATDTGGSVGVMSVEISIGNRNQRVGLVINEGQIHAITDLIKGIRNPFLGDMRPRVDPLLVDIVDAEGNTHELVMEGTPYQDELRQDEAIAYFPYQTERPVMLEPGSSFTIIIKHVDDPEVVLATQQLTIPPPRSDVEALAAEPAASVEASPVGIARAHRNTVRETLICSKILFASDRLANDRESDAAQTNLLEAFQEYRDEIDSSTISDYRDLKRAAYIMAEMLSAQVGGGQKNADRARDLIIKVYARHHDIELPAPAATYVRRYRREDHHGRDKKGPGGKVK